MGTQYIDYDSINDIVYWITRDLILKFTVKLANKNKEGNRESFYKEFQYSSKYADVPSVKMIKRSPSYYLSIENIRTKANVMIRVENMIVLQQTLNEVVKHLFNNALWSVKDNKLIMKGAVSPLSIPNLIGDKWLCFEPTVIEYDGVFDRGVRLTMPDEQYIVHIDEFMGFVYLINNFDMYGNAAILLNSVHVPYGSGLYKIADDGRFNNPPQEAVHGVQRTIQTQPKSFFNRIDKLEG